MTTDFRALCAELLMALENAISIIYCEDGTKHISTAKPIVNRARAALADEPAVPAPTVMEIIELSEEAEAAGLGQVDFACAVLARWGTFNLTQTWRSPADGEVAELVAWLRERATWCTAEDPAHKKYDRAAELLERQTMPEVGA